MNWVLQLQSQKLSLVIIFWGVVFEFMVLVCVRVSGLGELLVLETDCGVERVRLAGWRRCRLLSIH